MAQDQDKMMNKRRKRRAQLKNQRMEELRRIRRGFLAAGVILAACLVAIFCFARDTGIFEKDPEATEAVSATLPSIDPNLPLPTETEDSESLRYKPPVKIHIRAGGDINVTSDVVSSGKSGDKYDYTKAFIDVQALLSDADLTLLNFEGSICGEPYGTETRSAPPELLTGLINAGVDMLQTANSYTIYNGLIGMTATLQNIENSGLISVGAYATPSEYARSKGYTLLDIQGVKVAFVAFTKGLGGMGMPAGNEDCVNLLYEDYDSTYQKINTKKITKVLRAAAAEEPDLTIALLHWGSEYNDAISETQLRIKDLMLEEGVDVILGTHPHTVQKIEYEEESGQLIAYSLGDFYGDASRAGSNYSIILDLEITKDFSTGATRVTDYSYFPIYTLSQSEREEKNSVYKQVMRIGTAMEARDGNFVDRITGDAYRSMEYSLQRISDRIRGEEQEDSKSELEKHRKKKEAEKAKKKKEQEEARAAEETMDNMDVTNTPMETAASSKP